MNRLMIIAAVFLLTAVSGVAHDESGVADDKNPASAPIRLGILHSLSGPMAISEKSLVDAAVMAIDEINARGGVLGRRLEAVVEDGASDSQTFARKAEKLIVEDKVASLFGCWTSDSRKSVIRVLEQHDQLLWYPVQYEGQESNPHVIYTGAVPNQQIIPAVEWCRREFGPRMFLVGSDYIFPKTANEIIKRQLDDFGMAPVAEEYLPLDSSDFAEIVSRIQQLKPDVVLNTINGSSNQAFFQALQAAGIDSRQVPVMSFSIAEDELRFIGKDLTTGHYCSWSYFQSLDNPANRRFVREFHDRYGTDRVTDDPIEAAYFQIYLFARAVEKAGNTEIDAIRRAARGLIFAAPCGLVRIDPRNQHTWKVSRVGRIQKDGQFKVVWSSEDPLPPRPYLPETFIAIASLHGALMFESLSAMIDQETQTNPGNEREQVLTLAAMSDVRGYLSDARMRFPGAAQTPQTRSRVDFEEAWHEFERRLDRLTERQDRFTPQQRESFERFGTAKAAFSENAGSMFEALYNGENDLDKETP